MEIKNGGKIADFCGFLVTNEFAHVYPHRFI